jgi:flavin-dependent dehydrogenase
MSAIPKRTQALVIGGGPAGSTTATLLARNGVDVTLLELSRFPRYHIGESLLPSILPIMDLLGAREKMDNYGYTLKQGAFLEWGQERWPLNFGEMAGDLTYGYQVIRSEFDHMLLKHSAEQGAKIFEGIEVRSLHFEGDRPVRASYLGKHDNGGTDELGEITFDYMIDASGRDGVMSNHYLNNRRFHDVFKNIAFWGYWKDYDKMGTGRAGDIAVGSIPNGWIWGIPLHDDTMSVGVVMHKDAVAAKRGIGLDEIYCQAIESSNLISNILKNATLSSPLKTETDYSYTAEQFSGPGYFLCGDAACFLDPLLSSGVHLATFSGLLAAASISSILNGEVTEEEASNFFEKSYRQAYLRFLVFLSAFYDINRGRDAYFWEAQRLTSADVDANNLKAAFLHLVTGLKDLSDAQTDTHHFVLETMSKRIDENLNFRKDKQRLESLEGKELAQRKENANFFSSVEGLFALNKEEAVNGLYVTNEPRLHLTRVA